VGCKASWPFYRLIIGDDELEVRGRGSRRLPSATVRRSEVSHIRTRWRVTTGLVLKGSGTMRDRETVIFWSVGFKPVAAELAIRGWQVE
jgi:hypothetical protein